jgi:EAL and modified HD-GYP domain-containing signal transduction protein
LRLAQTYLPMNIRTVAEKVETHNDFHRTRRCGYAFFQGYFFSRPELLARNDFPPNQMNRLLVLQAVNRPPMDVEEVARESRPKRPSAFAYCAI